MAELADLTAALAAITTAVTDVTTELKAVADALVALKATSPIDPAAVEAAAQSLTTLAQNLEASVATTKTDTGV